MQDSLFQGQALVNKKADKKTKNKDFESVQALFEKYQVESKPGYISQEFQDFGYRLALELDDLDRVSLYMRLAKVENRGILEQALSFVSDANARNKARLFMWKMKQLKDSKEAKTNDKK